MPYGSGSYGAGLFGGTPVAADTPAIGREPLTIVEIDCDACSLVYGTGACTAVLGTTGDHKCYNTRKTCQDIANFTLSTLTLRFAKNQSNLPKGQTIFPALQSVSTRAGEINLSGIDPNKSALGQRARVTAQFKDFAYHDGYTDPYRAERLTGAAQADTIGYDPATRGTFFAKLHARNPYYVGRAMRVKTGYVGDSLGAMRTRHYVIDERSGPDTSGNVSIEALDVLDLASNDKALAPAPSRGKLAAAITATATSLTLSPASIGAEYATSGRICIGREVATFTRSGDVLTLTARGLDGTTAASHSVDDLVQQCLRYERANAATIIDDLLLTYAALPAGYVDTVQHQADVTRWSGGILMTATITKPTGVARLIGEICQHGLYVWWDEVNAQVRLKVNHPLDIGETYYPITDAANLIRGSVSVTENPDMRISTLLFWHGQIDPTSGDGENNYQKLVVAGLDEADTYEQTQVKTIYSRWFGQSGDDAAAVSIATRLWGRYKDTPKTITGQLDIKDGDLELAALIQVQSYLVQDFTGLAAAEPMQIQYLEESAPGNRITFKAQTFTFAGRYGFITETGRGNYAAASAAQKTKGTYIVAAASPTFGDGTGPYLMF